MPANKNALIRYKTIDNCLRNRMRRWTLPDLVDACNDALYDMEGTSCSTRTVQSDIQMMRSNKLGYKAPIEVYDHRYYRYSDPDFSIMEMPLSQNDYVMMKEAVDMLRQFEGFGYFEEMSDVLSRLQDNLAISKGNRTPIIHFDSVPDLKGLKLLNPLYNYIANRQTLKIIYQSFDAKGPNEFVVFPYLLKEFRNRWFLYCSRTSDMLMYNFALDRIIDIETCPDVEFKDNPNFDKEHFFDDLIGVSKNVGNKPTTVKFKATRKQSQYLITKPIHPSQKIVERIEETGEHIFSICVITNFELYSVLLSYGTGIEVISPARVRHHIKMEIDEMAKCYAQ